MIYLLDSFQLIFPSFVHVPKTSGRTDYFVFVLVICDADPLPPPLARLMDSGHDNDPKNAARCRTTTDVVCTVGSSPSVHPPRIENREDNCPALEIHSAGQR